MIYTEEVVGQLIKATIYESVKGFEMWLINETDIVDKDSRDVLPNTEISLKPSSKPVSDYIYPLLVKHGITITNDNTTTP